jgi:hypothetical protein
VEQDLLADLQGLEVGEDAFDVADVDAAESLQQLVRMEARLLFRQ